jgi:hypothetical protein
MSPGPGHRERIALEALASGTGQAIYAEMRPHDPRFAARQLARPCRESKVPRAASYRRDSGSVCRREAATCLTATAGTSFRACPNSAQRTRRLRSGQPTRSRRPSPTSGSAPGSPGPRFPRRRGVGIASKPIESDQARSRAVNAPPGRPAPRQERGSRAASSSNDPTNQEVISKPRDRAALRPVGISVSGDFRVRFGLLDGVGCMVGLRHAGWASR